MEYPWYCHVDKASTLQQGDFIVGMSVPRLIYTYRQARRKNKPQVDWAEATWIILTQSCDLDPENGEIPEYIVVCPVAPADSYGINYNTVRDILTNRRPIYHGLKATDDPISSNKPLIVNFLDARYAQYHVVKEYAEKQKMEQRLRLNSPYVENMAIRFGHTFSRIGYPSAFPTKEENEQLKKLLGGSK